MANPRRLHLKRLVAPVLAALATLLLVGSLLTLRSLSRASLKASHAQEVQLAVARLLTTLVDAETGQRGYLATGASAFLGPYERARRMWRSEFEELMGLTQDNSAQQRRLQVLQQVIEQRFTHLARGIGLRERGVPATALAAEMMVGKALMDEIRAAVDAIVAEEGRLDQRRNQAVRVRERLAWATLTAALLLVSFLVVYLVFHRRELSLLQQQSDERNLLLSELPVAVCLYDIQRARIVFANPETERLLGAGVVTLPGSHQLGTLLRAKHLDGSAYVLSELPVIRASKGASVRGEEMLLPPLGDGHERIVRNSAIRVTTAKTAPGYVIMILDDVTEQRMRSVEREQTSALAETFIGILGHDLRNPLTAIELSASALLSAVRAAPQSKGLNQILASAGRMARMVDELLDLTRARLGGGFRLARRQVELSQVVKSAIEELKSAHPSAYIEAQLAPRLSGDWDVDRITQVLVNLVANAIEHGDPAAPITVRTSDHDTHAILEVHNFGEAIPAGVIPILFEPFRQTGARAGLHGGLGLGLFISDQLVRAHGGTLTVRSSAAEGTTFVVSLPKRVRELELPQVPTPAVH